MAGKAQRTWVNGHDHFVPPPRRFLTTAAKRGNVPAYYTRHPDGHWVATPWTAFRDEVRQAARALIAMGVKPGDVVAVMGYNKPDWVVMALAAMMVGASVAGIYFTSSAQDAAYIINHAQCALVLCETRDHFQKIAKERAQLNVLQHVIMMRDAPLDDPLQMSWDAFLAQGDPRFDAEAERRLEALQKDDAGCLIYTSGTTGPPKAVQLSHGALAAASDLIPALWKVSPEDAVLSYLPLAHIAERMVTVHFQATVGIAVYFAPNALEVGKFLLEVRPDIFFGVPRVFEKMAAAIQLQMSATTGLKKRIAAWALEKGQAWHTREQKGHAPGFWLTATKPVASALVHKKVKRAVGLDRARYVACGAAPIPEAVLRFLNGIDIPIREVWGMSETCAAGTTNLPGATKIGSVGRPHPGLDVKIAKDGEILVKGPTNFSGYARDPEASARALVNGWLHTGDLGRIDEDGFVYITGRKKDIIITSGGKNIAPANIEMDLASLPLIENAIVCGEGRPYLTALIALNATAVAQFAGEKGISQSDPAFAAKLNDELQRGIDAVNERHARVESIRRFTILDQPLSVEAGDLTPTLKVKRAAVMKRHQHRIETMYASANAA